MGHSLQSKTARYVILIASINNGEEEKCFVDSNDATRNSTLEVVESRGSMIASIFQVSSDCQFAFDRCAVPPNIL